MAGMESSPRTAGRSSTIRRSRRRVIKALTYITTAYKEGYVPPGALSWSDADDNNAFHAKQVIMDLDGTISTELSLYHKKELYDDIVTMSLPHDNTGKPMPSPLGVFGCFVPVGAKNAEVAKDFLKYVIQPKVANEYLKQRARPITAGSAGLGQKRPVLARPQ
jgi:multiple sugar transport system substrate-binding protein